MTYAQGYNEAVDEVKRLKARNVLLEAIHEELVWWLKQQASATIPASLGIALELAAVGDKR